jgi:DNA-binding response OmpR family regulator
MSKARILVVDDEEDLCEILQFNLESEGYEVETANSAEEALTKDLASYNLLMLDVMMGEISGFKMAGMIRKNEKLANLPIIFITAKDTENDMLTGFNIGADDYISKPFSIREVTVRVKAILRRTLVAEPSDKDAILQFENLKIDTTRKKVFLDDAPVDLTKKELEMLLLLVSHPGRVYSREDILTAVWSDDVYVLDRTIDVNITRLRKKLGDFGQHIVTRLGYGYCFDYK